MIKWAQRTVLMIEDNQVITTIVQRCCEKFGGGLDVIVEQDGLSGYKTACEKQPGLIILDMMMPGCDGVGFLNMYREGGKLKDIPVLVCSSLDMQKLDEVRAAYPMVKAVIQKPVSPSKIIELIRTFLPSGQAGPSAGNEKREPEAPARTETRC